MIYVGIIYYGSYDTRETILWSVSTNRSVVIASINNFVFPDDDCNYGSLETWENNVRVKEECIRE